MLFKKPNKYEKIYHLKDKEFFWEGHCKDCREEIALFRRFEKRFEELKYNPYLTFPFTHGREYEFFNTTYSMRWIRLERELCKFVEFEYPDIDSENENDYNETISNIAAIQLKILNQRNIPLILDSHEIFYQNICSNVWFPDAYWTRQNDGVMFLCQTHFEKIKIPESKMSVGSYKCSDEECGNISIFKFRKDLEIDNTQFENLSIYLSEK